MKIASLAMLSASLSIAGCAASTPPTLLPSYNPVDPAMGIHETGYRPIVVYTRREPVDPQDWRGLNDRLSPASDNSTTKNGAGS
ncbi:hypothetical protein [Mesorhizobium sp. 1B3]|uniref:hypothetical protein n=1 Tax=Mesorhizobium sp. 1B3 TaxID=3243599 RepID=UPI003D9636A0